MPMLRISNVKTQTNRFIDGFCGGCTRISPGVGKRTWKETKKGGIGISTGKGNKRVVFRYTPRLGKLQGPPIDAMAGLVSESRHGPAIQRKNRDIISNVGELRDFRRGKSTPSHRSSRELACNLSNNYNCNVVISLASRINTKTATFDISPPPKKKKKKKKKKTHHAIPQRRR